MRWGHTRRIHPSGVFYCTYANIYVMEQVNVEPEAPAEITVIMPETATALVTHKAPYNPREISKHDFKALQRSIQEFGDLSGVVLNRKTGNLVGGHQRVEAFKQLAGQAPVTIHEQLEAPNSVGTVARGFVTIGDEKFTYRVVEWDLSWEQAANIAANRIQGQFDKELLAQLVSELNEMDASLLELTGNTEKEIADLLQLSSSPEIDLPEGDKPGFQQMTFTLADEQAEVLQAAIDRSKSRHDFSAELNENSNGNALYYIAREYLDNAAGLTTTPPPAAPAPSVAIDLQQ